MEKMGAEVIAFDIGEDEEWDTVPFSQYDYRARMQEFRGLTNGFKNAFWYAHRAHKSKAKAVYGSIYRIPEEIGIVDIATFGCILLHLRDPFRALQSALRLVKDTVIVTDLAKEDRFPFSSRLGLGQFSTRVKRYLLSKEWTWARRGKPYMEFLPDYRKLDQKDAWWYLSPDIIMNFLGVLGFEDTRVTYHQQKAVYSGGARQWLYTVVGRRTREIGST
jgi:hypothetical protein